MNVERDMQFRLITTQVEPGQFVVSLTGDVDLYTAPELKTQLHELIDDSATRIIVDLTETTFVDSTTLGVLLGALKRFRPNGGELLLVCPDPTIRRIFEITLLDRVFSIFATREAAVDFPSASI